MVNPVTVADLEARFRPLSEDERTVARALLDDAWAIALTRRPSLDMDVANGVVSWGLAVAVISAMVLRVLRNPNGVRQWSVDDYSETRDSAVSAGVLYVSDEELALLSPGGTGDGAFTIRPIARGAYAYPPDPWVPGTPWI